MAIATRLFYDADATAIRRGAGGKGKGSARRLATVLMQFDRTFVAIQDLSVGDLTDEDGNRRGVHQGCKDYLWRDYP